MIYTNVDILEILPIKKALTRIMHRKDFPSHFGSLSYSAVAQGKDASNIVP
uniref:Uncharacterized protein n=1 Tax=Anguilla anguilla TaxID=7936 RepID=A0A0E9WVN7_ANGAN